MIKRVFDDNDSMYYCTLCNRPYKALREANEHAKFCGQAVPMPTPEHEAMSRASSLISRAKLTDKQRKERIEKYFPSPAKAATFDEDDDTQFYMNEARTWQGLTDEEYQQILIQHDGAGLLAFYNLVETKLKEKNT